MPRHSSIYSMTSCMSTNAPANRQGNVPSWLPILEGWRCLPRTLKAHKKGKIGSQTLSAKTPSRNVSLPARTAHLLTSTKPPSLSELTYGGISAVTSHLNGRWGYKKGSVFWCFATTTPLSANCMCYRPRSESNKTSRYPFSADPFRWSYVSFRAVLQHIDTCGAWSLYCPGFRTDEWKVYVVEHPAVVMCLTERKGMYRSDQGQSQ
ncbi:hypothetical protein V8E51_013447 [Hyaloscypha variabilis]